MEHSQSLCVLRMFFFFDSPHHDRKKDFFSFRKSMDFPLLMLYLRLLSEIF